MKTIKEDEELTLIIKVSSSKAMRFSESLKLLGIDSCLITDENCVATYEIGANSNNVSDIIRLAQLLESIK